MSEWISVDERLPKDEVNTYRGENNGEYPEYIVMVKDAKVPTVLVFEGEFWVDDDGAVYNVTHWMPMPAPPEVTQ